MNISFKNIKGIEFSSSKGCKINKDNVKKLLDVKLDKYYYRKIKYKQTYYFSKNYDITYTRKMLTNFIMIGADDICLKIFQSVKPKFEDLNILINAKNYKKVVDVIIKYVT